MASLVPAHITVTYPEETGDDELLLRRAAKCVECTSPFRVQVGEIFAEDRGRGGVFFAVEDVEGGWARLRHELLAPPFRLINFPAHITVAHPRTSRQAVACLAELAGYRLSGEFKVSELLFTEITTTAFKVLQRFALRPR
jgi:2'-5' RNA ligase